MRKPALIAAAGAATLAAGLLPFLVTSSADGAEPRSALKTRGVQYDAPGRDDNRCVGGNTKNEYLTIKNYSPTLTVNLKNYLVKDAAGNQFRFTATHHLQPGDYVKLRGGNGTDSDGGNVVYRDNCNFIWNNGGDTIYLYKPSGPISDRHSYRSSDDGNRDGYIRFH
ncbi:lamin tail domain-containing protein [Streptomyces boninensis]|uniref:lamin tail domain-containing protein n=1 Tax=Streptomyces boninensis TaxID=2039455 RepID=UPI003B227B95